MFLLRPLTLAALYIFGVYWCYLVIRRFRDDIQELREVKGITRKVAIIFVWVITVPIAITVVGFLPVIIRNIALFVRELL